MIRRAASVLTVSLLTTGLLAAPALAEPTPVPLTTLTTTATVQPLAVAATDASYPVFGPDGAQTGTRDFTVSTAGGNCCEVYVTSDGGGRLIEFGGTFPTISDDRGKTWSQVTPVTPLVNGEGANVVAPNGDVYAISWDPYTGDHLQSFRYTKATNTWEVGEITVHQPFYDREWISYVEGPLSYGGATYDHLLVVRGAYPYKEPFLVSTDGLHYDAVSSPFLDEMSTTPTSGAVTTATNPAADLWQPHPSAGVVPLNDGGALYVTQSADLADCPLSRLDRTFTSWTCTTLPGGAIDGALRQDSRGVLVQAAPSPDGTRMTLKTSRDGGATWAQTVITPPQGGTLEAGLYDLKADGRSATAVISARYDGVAGGDPNLGQDLVFRIDTSGVTPALVETMYLGRGDLNTANDASGSTGDRFDYATVTILPDGTVAASFQDTTTTGISTTMAATRDPALAVELSALATEPVVPEAPVAALLPLLAAAGAGAVALRARRRA